MAFAFFRSLARVKSFSLYPRRQIYVLGIESSCDDTAAAVVNESGNVLGEGHFSQARIHLEAGGIIPIIASNLHHQYIRSVVDTTLKESQLDFKDLNAIAVSVKPGLIMCLQEGVEYAKDLCTLYSKPLIPIHHMEAHALTARMIEDVKFPFLVFLISGGNCILGVAKSVNKFYTLGQTVDQAPGNALDFVARCAKLKNLDKFKGMISGAAIETAAIEDLGPDEVIPDINDLCAGILRAMSRHMCQRLEIAFHYVHTKGWLNENEKCLVMSGGVACNKYIQKMVKKVCDQYEYKFVVPPKKLCTDNGIMIAWNGIEILRENLPVVQPDQLSSVKESSKCPFGEDISQDVKKTARAFTFKFMKL